MVVLSIFGVTEKEFDSLQKVELLTEIRVNQQNESRYRDAVLTLGGHRFNLHTDRVSTQQLDLPLTYIKKEAA